MKRGTNAVMQIGFDGLDLDSVESCEILFVQDQRRLTFDYPSERAVREGDHINLYWTEQETFAFAAGRTVYMDTHVHLRDAVTNPETRIAELRFDETLFRIEEIVHD